MHLPVGVVVLDGRHLNRVSTCHRHDDALSAVDGQAFDTVYPALGMKPRSQLAARAGALTAKDERLWVNDHQMTSVPGLYAAGDMVRGLNQISIAQAEAAIAATDIHNRLRPRERP